MRTKTTARQRREDNKVACARELSRSRVHHDVTQEEFARAAGVDETIAQRWEDKSRRETITAADLTISTGDAALVAIDLLRWIARFRHFTLAPLPAGRHPGDDVAMLAAAIKEHAEAIVIASVGVSVAGSAQLADLVREGTEAIEAMSAIVEHARRRLESLRGGERHEVIQ
jgi:transcriptional regulator with XRE-family HTH domain